MAAIESGSVFISHASPDKPFVRRLRSALEKSGFSTWVDEHELLPGDNLPGTIASALAEARVFVVVISAHSLNSRWLKYELRLATQRMIEGDLLVIPVRTDDAETPPEIRSLLWADFRTAFDDGWRVLHGALDRWTSKDAIPPPTRSAAVEGAFDVDDDNRARLRAVLSEHVPDVFRTIRVVEARTGYHSEIARTQLIDVLSHLSLLATRDELTSGEQAEHIAQLEAHCQRAMTVSAEEVVRNRLADLGVLWDKYVRVATPYREDSSLRGAPKHSALEALRLRIRTQVDAARALRISGTWDDARLAAGEWHEIATLCEELTDQLNECLAAADVLRRRDSEPVRAGRRLRYRRRN